MVAELLALEIALKASVGGLLTLLPRTLSRVLGLAPVQETFWPRLLGATLLALAGATFLERQASTASGLGIAGHTVLNLVAALAIVGALILGKAAPTRRGRIILTVTAMLLALLGLVELAWA
jgi:hypothetical protein